MKTINVTFEDSEYKDLDEIKQDMSWRDFILTLVQSKEGDKSAKNPTK